MDKLPECRHTKQRTECKACQLEEEYKRMSQM